MHGWSLKLARRVEQLTLFITVRTIPMQDVKCRKPKPGMLMRAAREHNIELSSAYLVGDFPTDIEAGKSVGMPQRFSF